MGVVAVLMGLNLLGVLPVSFPSLNVDVRQLPVPPVATAYAAGLTFALAASPCSTPILASLLAFAATQDSPVAGASLLFTYSLGYIAPVLIAATATVRPHPTPTQTPPCLHSPLPSLSPTCPAIINHVTSAPPPSGSTSMHAPCQLLESLQWTLSTRARRCRSNTDCRLICRLICRSHMYCQRTSRRTNAATMLQQPLTACMTRSAYRHLHT